MHRTIALFRLVVMTGIVVAMFSSTRLFAGDSDSALDVRLSLEFENRIRPLLAKYCLDCHTGDSAEASTDIEMYRKLSRIRESQSQWEQIRGLIRIGAMPPPDHDTQPSDSERATVADWIERALYEVDCNDLPPIPPITVRRLNRLEYDSTVRDLFGVDLAPSSTVGFVSDDVGNGFDNQGEVLSLSPIAMEKYAQAAEWIAQRIIQTDPELLRTQTTSGEPIRIGGSFVSEFLTSDGEYEIAARVRFGRKGDQSVEFEAWLDGKLLDRETASTRTREFNWTERLTAGTHRFELRVPETDENRDDVRSRESIFYIDTVTFEGPRKGQPPLAKAHRQLMIAEPSDQVSVEQAASKVIGEFLPRCYRRPINRDEKQKMVDIVVKASEAGWSFPESVQFAIQAALMSPEFLFRIESSFEQATSNVSQSATSTAGPTPLNDIPISDFDLANRLSYFLWSSMPDEKLFQLAASGELSKSQVLHREIDRMIDSPKAHGLVHGFFDQWLGLRNIPSASVDDERFPIWTAKLSEVLMKETFLFAEELLRKGKLEDVLTADYTFINPRLADFYDMEFEGEDPSELYYGSRSSSDYERRADAYRDENRWIRVALPPNRQGVLTHGSILTLTSNPDRTSPVKRGKWVLENILGDPPPPAPPGVPSLEESAGENSKLSLRKQLEIHRANPSCASCHKVLDPIGLGLENFDAIGRWREKDSGATIDSEGELADGRKFKGPTELLNLLRSEKPKIARHFSTQLLTYALGRGLQREDRCEVDSIVAQAEANEFTIRGIIHAIADSRPFRYRTR